MLFSTLFCKPSSFFAFLTYIDFGPDGFSCKKGRSHVYKLKRWAEMNVWRTLNVHFGHLGRAEIAKSLIHICEVSICRHNRVMYHFCLFLWIIELQRWISAQEMLKSKKFRRLKSFKMKQRVDFQGLETFFRRFKSGRSHFVRSKKVKIEHFRNIGLEISALFGPEQITSPQAFWIWKKH